MDRVKHHTNCAQVLGNNVSPEVNILIPHITINVPMLWNNSSYRSIIIILRIYIIQSLDQSKLTIISTLNILPSGKLASKERLVDYHKVLVTTWKMELRTYFYAKK